MFINADWGKLELALQLAAEEAQAELPEGYDKMETYKLDAWVDEVEDVNGVAEADLRAAVRAWCERRTVRLIARECPEIRDLVQLPDFWPLNCEAWHNDAVCFFRYRTADRIGSFYMQATDVERRESEYEPRMGIEVYTTTDGETEGELVASFSSETLEGFGFDVAERVVHLCKNPGRTMTACRFGFDDSPTWNGWTDGTTWNGFENVWCDRATFEAIVAHFEALGDTEGVEQMRELQPDDHGRYSFAYGYSTQIVP